MEEDVPWYKYYVLLAVALDLGERDKYWEFLLAGGKAKDWKWSSPDRAGTESRIRSGLWNKIVAKFGGKAMSGHIGKIAQQDWKKIEKVTEEMSDGSTRVRYLDDAGNDITEAVEEKVASGEEIFMRKGRD